MDENEIYVGKVNDSYQSECLISLLFTVLNQLLPDTEERKNRNGAAIARFWFITLSGHCNWTVDTYERTQPCGKGNNWKKVYKFAAVSWMKMHFEQIREKKKKRQKEM